MNRSALAFVVVFLASDNGIGAVGPIANQTDNDIGVLTGYLTSVSGVAQPRQRGAQLPARRAALPLPLPGGLS